MPAKNTHSDVRASNTPIWMAEKVIQSQISQIKPYANNNRVHAAKNVDKLKASVAQFGFVTPILLDGSGTIIAGHGRYEAAKALGLNSVPTVVADHLSEAEVRALRIADNKLAELSDWNEAALQIEFAELMDLSLDGELNFDLDITGFETPEIDIIIDSVGEVTVSVAETVETPDPAAPVVTEPGDLWVLGDHRIFCGDALQAQSYDTLLEGETPQIVFTDPPYNVPVNGHVRSGNSAEHREFAMASGEMTDSEFRGFLSGAITQLFDCLPNGGIADDLHGLASYRRTDYGGQSSWIGPHQSLRLEQDERRHGQPLSLKA
ncbi:ParB N-terminal domain-containing protein [Ruegeria arenilitoris]|nr:ParB/Srx family N-terminal domain-containing protein [Ruegeria arenilitoris]MBY6083825.1 ParB N-terminal domain-containing protein [Ruegeria arenilitoris]